MLRLAKRQIESLANAREIIIATIPDAPSIGNSSTYILTPDIAFHWKSPLVDLPNLIEMPPTIRTPLYGSIERYHTAPIGSHTHYR